MAGEYCAGGMASQVACGPDRNNYDHDLDPATPCDAMTDCTGQTIEDRGSPTTDRTCAAADPDLDPDM
jgi:hypothetical protein